MFDSRYFATLNPGECGRIQVRFPDIPSALTEGSDRAVALANAQDALDTAIMGLMIQGQPIPTPSVSHEGRSGVYLSADPILIAKAALREAMARQGVGASELARRIESSEALIRRLCDPRHRSKLDSLTPALDALGLGISVSVQPKAA